MKETISIKLVRTLLKGKRLLSNEACRRIIGFLRSQQSEDTSFINKSGKEDIYYTVFGWMLSYVFGLEINKNKSDAYLDTLNENSLDLIHYAAFMRCRMLYMLMNGSKLQLIYNYFSTAKIKDIAEFKNIPHQDQQSPYTLFIYLSLLEDTGNLSKLKQFGYNKLRLESRNSPISDLYLENYEKNNKHKYLMNYHVESGGYKNTRDGLTPTTNATVAALAVKGQLQGYKDNEDLAFLYHLQDESGGFRASNDAPVPDLLSTATSLFMLQCYDCQPKYPSSDFIDAHWLDSGGFAATLLDDKSDVEYTFYGLLALGATKKTFNKKIYGRTN